MELPKDDPERAEELGEAESPIYSVEQYRAALFRKDRTIARLRNALRLARAFSTEARVQTILDEARDI